MHPTGIATAVFVVGMLAESWYSWRFLRAIKRYPELWAHSGYRSIATDSNLVGAWDTVRYLKNRDYLVRRVAHEIAFCEAHRKPVIYSYFLSAIGVVAFFASIFAFGWPPGW